MIESLRSLRFEHILINRRNLLVRFLAVTVAGLAASNAAVRRTSGNSSALQGTPVTCASTVVSASDLGTPSPAHTVKMTNQLRFEPENIIIRAGATIEWVNESTMPHTATADPAKNPVAESHPDYVLLPAGAEPWSSELLQPGERYSHRFQIPGEYRYFCIPHVLSGMRGAVTVEC